MLIFGLSQLIILLLPLNCLFLAGACDSVRVSLCSDSLNQNCFKAYPCSSGECFMFEDVEREEAFENLKKKAKLFAYCENGQSFFDLDKSEQKQVSKAFERYLNKKCDIHDCQFDSARRHISGDGDDSEFKVPVDSKATRKAVKKCIRKAARNLENQFGSCTIFDDPVTV